MRASGSVPGAWSWATTVGMLATVLVAGAQASTWVALDPVHAVEPVATRVEVLERDASRLTVAVELAGLELTARDTPAGPFVLVEAPVASLGGAVGTPALPVVRRLFVVPEGATVETSARALGSSLFDLRSLGYSHRVFPVQPPVSEDAPEAERLRFHYLASAYQTAGAAAPELAVVSELGRMRGQRLFLLEVRPVSYEPGEGLLTVCSQVEVAINFSGGAGQASTCVAGPVLEQHVLNPVTQRAPAGGAGNYLIVVADVYASAAPLADFISAKTTAGFNVSTYSVPAGTSAAAIKTYIETQWASPQPPDYVLLVGDTDTIPVWTGGGNKASPTDLPYSCMDGPDDWYPDIPLGRWTVRSVDHLQAVVDKTLFMAAGVFDDPDYVRRAAFIAGPDDDCGDEPTHDHVISTYLDPRDYLSNKLYRRTYYVTTAQTLAALDDGNVFVIFYGHSGTTGWHSPGMDQDDVRDMTNEGMYSIFVNISCDAGDFTVEETFCETWLIEPDKAAAAVYCATQHLYTGSVPWSAAGDLEIFFFDAIYEGGIREIGVAWHAALVDLVAKYGPSDPRMRDYSEMFNLLGDPSLRVPAYNAFMVTANPEAQDLCAPPATEAKYAVDVALVGEFTDPVLLTVKGEPAGTWVKFTSNNLPAPYSSMLIVGGVDKATPGEYELEITGTAGKMVRTETVRLGLANSAPGAVTLVSPPDGASGVFLKPEFTWDPASQAMDYTLQVASDYEFTDVVYSATAPDNNHTYADDEGLQGHFYWRVKANNGCAEGDYSDPFEFSTLSILPIVSYDMLNGEQGSLTYFDDSYNGEGDNTVPLAPLSGGVGDLTDGIFAIFHANYTSEPYVGWITVDSTITFRFGQPVYLDTLLVHVDDSSGYIGVHPPDSATLVMGGETLPFTIVEPPGDEPFTVVFADLDLVGDTLELTLEDGNPSIAFMVSEVQGLGRLLEGACCQGEVCEVLSEPDCVAAGGEYQGDDTTCDPNPCLVYEPECLIISEVVVGAESGGCPRWIEITNTGLHDYSFLEGGIIMQHDRSADVDIDVDLTGATIPAGAAFVINSTQDGDCSGAYEFIYDKDPDFTTAALFGDGDDRYILTDAADSSNLLDIYGEFGTSGTGLAWEYTEGYAYRESAYNTGNDGTFDPGEWYFGGVGSLSKGNPTELLLLYTTPNEHEYDEVCNAAPGDVDADGDVDLDDYTLFQICLGGPDNYKPPAGCAPDEFEAADLEDDGDVDLVDFAWFAEAFTGPGA